MPVNPLRWNSRPATFLTGTLNALVAFLCLLATSMVMAQSDPPGRVARLSYLEGNASFALEGGGQWAPAEFNRPLTGGDQVAVGSGSRAELHSGAAALRMAGPARMAINALDDNTTRIQLIEGTLALRVRALLPGERFEINTANLAFVLSQPGEYRFDVDAARASTRITLHSGIGVAYGENAQAVTLMAPYQGSFMGRQLAQFQSLAFAPRDPFDDWASSRDQAEDQSIAARYLSRETIGYQQLDAHGSWSHDPQYGAIWLPRVVSHDWAPYRYGHWQWVAPWGWTWIDDAPWGFAPFHYGRWIQIDLRWCWVPGPRTVRPTYAPALVGFIGGGSNWQLSLGTGGFGVAWFPLAPGEAWQPAYRASPRYLDQINRWPQQRRDERAPNDYRYRQHHGALSAMPTEDFGQRRHARPFSPQRLQEADLSRAQVLPAPPRGRMDRMDREPDRSPGFAPRATQPGTIGVQPQGREPEPSRPQFQRRDEALRPPQESRESRELPATTPNQPSWPGQQPRNTDRPADEPRFQQAPPRRILTPQTAPQSQRMEPPVQRMEPPVQRMEPPVHRVEPPVQRMDPPIQRIEPPILRAQPRPQVHEPQAQPMQSPRQVHNEPQPPQQQQQQQQQQRSHGMQQEPQRQRSEAPAKPERGERRVPDGEGRR